MGIRELRVEASQLGIKNYSKLNKADLEAAVSAAKGQSKPIFHETTSDNAPAIVTGGKAQKIGEINGRLIFVSQQDNAESIGVLLGSLDKGDARKVRKMLVAAGFGKFAAVSRIVAQQKEAA